jgi:4-azaleucine resistance transporter AzlC
MWHEFYSGIKDEFPILFGVLPFGMVYGVIAISEGLSSTQAQAMSSIIAAGSSQIIIAQFSGVGAPLFVMILTGFIINSRHALYSASIAPHIRQLNFLWKITLAYLLTDAAYAVAITHYNKDGEGKLKHWYFLGAGVAVWISWQIGTAAGIFLGVQIPKDWPLDFALPLTFIALIVPEIKDRSSLQATILAGITAILVFDIPYKLGLLGAVLVGVVVGLWSETK